MSKFVNRYFKRRRLLRAAKKIHVGVCRFCCQALGFDTNELSREFVSAFWKGSYPHSLAVPVSAGWPLWNDDEEEEREQRVLALLLYREFIRTE